MSAILAGTKDLFYIVSMENNYQVQIWMLCFRNSGRQILLHMSESQKFTTVNYYPGHKKNKSSMGCSPIK